MGKIKAFETYAKDRGLNLYRLPGSNGYFNASTFEAYMAFCAGLTSQPAGEAVADAARYNALIEHDWFQSVAEQQLGLAETQTTQAFKWALNDAIDPEPKQQ